MPAVQGIVGVPTSEIVVSHYPPQHAVLTAAYAVQVVDGYLGQRGNVDLEFQLVRYLCGQLGIQGMDAFHHEDAVLPQLDALPVIVGISFFEVECGNFHPFTIEHALQVFVK
jgi:hypothetical protein